MLLVIAQINKPHTLHQRREINNMTKKTIAKNKLQGYREVRAAYLKHIYWAPTLDSIPVAWNINEVDNMTYALEEFTITFLAPMDGSKSNK